MIIKQVENDEEAKECDKLLTKLIHSEKAYNENINRKYIVKDYFKNLYNKKNNALFIAIDEKIIGYLYVKINTSDNGPEVDHEALIDGLFVEENYRNKKVATKLIERGKEWAKSTEAKYISLNVLSNNEVAKHLYYKEGFKEFSVILKQKL